MKRSALALCVLLGACATASNTYTADGRPAYSLNCSGAARSWGACLERAGDLCGTAGYDVLDRSGESGFIGTSAASASVSGNKSSFSGSGSSGGFLGSTHSRTMLVACKTKAD